MSGEGGFLGAMTGGGVWDFSVNFKAYKNSVEFKIKALLAKGEWDKLIEIGELAVEPLIAALKDEDARVRFTATRALGNT